MKKVLLYAKEENGELIFDNKRELSLFLAENKNKKFVVTLKRETGVRTDTQNNALHKYFELVADELNAGGYTVQIVLSQKIDLNWNTLLVKELLWRTAQQALLNKKSTVELDKVEDIDSVYEHLNRHLSEKFFIHVPFPTKHENRL